MRIFKRTLIALTLVVIVSFSLYQSVKGIINDPNTFLETSGNTIILVAIIVLLGLLWGKNKN